MLIKYSDGIYNGSVRNLNQPKRKSRKRRANLGFVPHGWGQLEYKNDVKYIGNFRNGYEHGYGKLIWANGDVYECYFRHGRPEATSLKFVHEKARARARISKLNSSLAECQNDLSLESEKTMQLALALDRTQERCQTMYDIALSAGADASVLNAIRDNV